MKKMRFLAIASLVLAFALAPVVDAGAKNKGGMSGGGNWGRSAPSYSAPKISAPRVTSGNVTKPSLSTQTQRATTTPTSGNVAKPKLSTPGNTAAKALPPAPQQRTALDRAASAKASADSVAKMRAEQKAKFTTPAPPINSAAIKSHPIASSYVAPPRFRDVNVYYGERGRFYGRLGYSRPIYVGLGAPYYGGYNSDYYVWAMRNDPAFYYHHQYDPGVIAWRRDYERIADQNAELRAELTRLDIEKARVTGPVNDKYVSEKVKPEMMLADSVAAGVTTPELSFATNEEGTVMAKVCDRFKAHAEDGMKITCLRTAGSYENLEKLAHGKVDAALAQSDVIDYMQREKIIKELGDIQRTAYKEPMFLMINRDSGIKSIADLKPGVNTTLVGPQGSGTEFSFRNLKKHATKAEKRSSWIFFSKTVDVRNEQYEGVGVKNALYKDGFKLVAENKNTTMLVLTGGNSSVLARVDAEYGDKVRLIPITGDPSFAKIEDKDGNPVYDQCEMPTAGYPKLFDGKTTIKTLCVQEVVVFSPAWSKKSGQTAEDVAFTAWNASKLDLEQLNGGVR